MSTICMKIDPRMHIGLHLVFFGKNRCDTWLWSAHEVFQLSPNSCSNLWSESADQELDLEELTRGFCSSRAAQVTSV
jgi:hypothetical protein